MTSWGYRPNWCVLWSLAWFWIEDTPENHIGNHIKHLYFILDAFFLAGKTGDKPNTDGTILPYPFDGKFYDYNDKSSPTLTTAFDGSKDITLKLPDNLNVSELKWLSVWCREFDVVLGDVKFPANFSFDNVVAFPGPSSHDGLDEEDPHSEAEAEAEAEPGHHHPNSAGLMELSLVSAILAAAAAMIN